MLADQFTNIQLTASLRGDLYNFGERGLAPGFVSKRYLLGTAPEPTFASEPEVEVFENPEPSSLVLAGLGILAMGLRRRR